MLEKKVYGCRHPLSQSGDWYGALLFVEEHDEKTKIYEMSELVRHVSAHEAENEYCDNLQKKKWIPMTPEDIHMSTGIRFHPSVLVWPQCEQKTLRRNTPVFVFATVSFIALGLGFLF